MSSATFECTKCRHREAETGEIRTTGGGASRYLNVQNQKFGFLACETCGYTEFYRMDGSGRFATVFDILTN